MLHFLLLLQLPHTLDFALIAGRVLEIGPIKNKKKFIYLFLFHD